MTVDEFVKLIFVIGVTFSIVGIAIQIMRLLGKTINILEDLRKPLQNVGELTDQIVEDYELVREAIGKFVEIISNAHKIVLPVIKIGRIFSLFSKTKENTSD